MTVSAGADLITRLNAGVRPHAAGEVAPRDTARFRDLLARAERGEVSSGLPVAVAIGAIPAGSARR